MSQSSADKTPTTTAMAATAMGHSCIRCPQCSLEITSVALRCPRCLAELPLGCSGNCRECAQQQR